MSLSDVFKKKFENDLKMKKDEFIFLEKFASFLDKFEKNPNNYRKIDIEIDYFKSNHACEHIKFIGDEVIKIKEYWDQVLSVLEGCEIIGCGDNPVETTFYFHDDRKLVSIVCFKTGKEKKE